MNLLKVIFLLIGTLFTLTNVYRVTAKNDILTEHILLQTIGIVGFITLQFNLL